MHLIFPVTAKFSAAIRQKKVFTRKKTCREDIYPTDAVQRGMFCMNNPAHRELTKAVLVVNE